MKRISLILVAVGVAFVLSFSHAEAGFTKDLYLGIKNKPEVSKLQEFLIAQGFLSGTATGSFGPLTQKAVQAFQKKNGIIPANGYWGAKTRAKANGVAGPGPTPSQGQKLISPATTTASVPAPAKFIPGISTSTKLTINGYWTLTATTTNARWPYVAEPAQRVIDPRAVVALYCHGKNKGDIWKGSGNIIHPKGYILTNRHVAADATYCEVAMPGKSARLPTRAEITDLSSNSSFDISGWRPYKAVNYFVPEQKEGLSEEEKFMLDFAIMKIDSINDDCEIFDGCGPLPSAFPFNPTANFHMPTSTAGAMFPMADEGNIKFYIPIEPNEMLMYGYPAIGLGSGSSHILRGNVGYALGYLPGDKIYPGFPITMLARVLHSTHGGASGSGVFYRGHIVGLIYAGYPDVSITVIVIPMPFISMILNESGKGWVLDPTSSPQ